MPPPPEVTHDPPEVVNESKVVDHGVSRRSFLQTLGVSAAASALSARAEGTAEAETQDSGGEARKRSGPARFRSP